LLAATVFEPMVCAPTVFAPAPLGVVPFGRVGSAVRPRVGNTVSNGFETEETLTSNDRKRRESPREPEADATSGGGRRKTSRRLPDSPRGRRTAYALRYSRKETLQSAQISSAARSIAFAL
jgi:hypothetical protein